LNEINEGVPSSGNTLQKLAFGYYTFYITLENKVMKGLNPYKAMRKEIIDENYGLFL